MDIKIQCSITKGNLNYEKEIFAHWLDVIVFKFWFDALFGADVDGENKREIKTCPPPPGFFG